MVLSVVKALVDEVRFMTIPDAATVKAGLQSGAVDLAQVSPIDGSDLKKTLISPLR